MHNRSIFSTSMDKSTSNTEILCMYVCMYRSTNKYILNRIRQLQHHKQLMRKKKKKKYQQYHHNHPNNNHNNHNILPIYWYHHLLQHQLPQKLFLLNHHHQKIYQNLPKEKIYFYLVLHL